MTLPIYLGTYTRRDSKGIYQIDLNTETQQLENLTLLIDEVSPTYLAQAQSGELFTVTTVDGLGGTAAYNKTAEGYQKANAITEEGAPTCYVAVDEKRQLVYAANYHKGEVLVYKINADGALTLTDKAQHEGTGPHENQEKAHAHYSDLTPDGRLVVCDLGTDEVFTYDVSNEGKLTEVARFTAQPGTGPRHIVFHPNHTTAYLFGELNSTVNVLTYDAATGSFTEEMVASTLPADYDGFNGGAAIRISKDGRFVYASNRGHNSIAIFAVKDNSVERIQLISTEGDFPRDFNLDPSGEFVVAANQNSDNLTLYRRDAESGQLSLLQKDVYAPEAVCVVFA